MSYRPYPPPAPLLIGYDPFRDLPEDHLARLKPTRPSREPIASRARQAPTPHTPSAPTKATPTRLSPEPGPKTTVLTSWPGMFQTSSIRPPDPHGAAGPNGIIQVVNVRIAYWDKSGSLIWGPVALDGMFAGVGNQYFSFDPRALFDPQSGRFYVVLIEMLDPESKQAF